MTDLAAISAQLEASLSLTTRPVAVTFGDTPPPGIAGPDKAAPAGCSFWEIGAARAIATSTADHEHCAIGIHTHNMAGAPAAQSGELQAALGAMQGLDYVRPEEVQALPVLSNTHGYVTYQPLSELKEAPTVVLLFAHAAQSLVLSEAVARVDGASPIAMGRPACAMVPAAINSGNASVSYGCCGARAYLDNLTDDTALWVLPGAKVGAYAKEIKTFADANNILTQFHTKRRADIEAGGRPTVEQSLARLQS